MWWEIQLSFPLSEAYDQTACPGLPQPPIQEPQWQILTHFQLHLHALFSLLQLNKSGKIPVPLPSTGGFLGFKEYHFWSWQDDLSDTSRPCGTDGITEHSI